MFSLSLFSALPHRLPCPNTTNTLLFISQNRPFLECVLFISSIHHCPVNLWVLPGGSLMNMQVLAGPELSG